MPGAGNPYFYGNVAIEPVFYRWGDDPVKLWASENEAEARAAALLEANTSPAERSDFGLLVTGSKSGFQYHIKKPSGFGRPAYVAVQTPKASWAFCVYSEGVQERPASDELLAMALYIKYDEPGFLARAVPHVGKHNVQDYRALVDSVIGPRAQFLHSGVFFGI